MSKWRRLLIVGAGIVVGGGAYLWFFGVQTISALMVHYQYRKLPDVAKTPAPLPDLSISSAPHKTVSYFGYEFELPWDDVDEAKDRTVGQIHVEAFHSGNALWFSTFPPKTLVDAVAKDGKLSPEDLKRVFGEDAVESDYALHKKMLETTPSEIGPFMTKNRALSGQMILIIKGLSMPKASSGIFFVQTGDFKGFQFDGPPTHPARITVELYSKEGGIDVIFFQKDGVPGISQPEINRVIQSIHKVAASQIDK